MAKSGNSGKVKNQLGAPSPRLQAGAVGFACADCSFQSVSKPGLRAHRSHAHNSQTCAYCKKSFQGLFAVRKHEAAEHPNESRQSRTCDKCGFECADKTALIAHQCSYEEKLTGKPSAQLAAKRAKANARRRKIRTAHGDASLKKLKAETASRRTAYQSYCAEMKEDAIRLLEEYKFSDRESQRYTQRLSNEEDWAAFRLLLLLRYQQHVRPSMKNVCLVPKCGREFLPGDAGKWRHMWTHSHEDVMNCRMDDLVQLENLARTGNSRVDTTVAYMIGRKADQNAQGTFGEMRHRPRYVGQSNGTQNRLLRHRWTAMARVFAASDFVGDVRPFRTSPNLTASIYGRIAHWWQARTIIYMAEVTQPLPPIAAVLWMRDKLRWALAQKDDLHRLLPLYEKILGATWMLNISIQMIVRFCKQLELADLRRFELLPLFKTVKCLKADQRKQWRSFVGAPELEFDDDVDAQSGASDDEASSDQPGTSATARKRPDQVRSSVKQDDYNGGDTDYEDDNADSEEWPSGSSDSSPTRPGPSSV